MYTGFSAMYLKPFAPWGYKETSTVGKLDVKIGFLVPLALQWVDWRLSSGLVELLLIWLLSFSRAESTPPCTQNCKQKTEISKRF